MRDFVAEPAPADSDAAVADDWRDQARSLVADLFDRSPAVYWTDLLLSAGGAWAATAIYMLAPAWSPAQIAAFVVAGVLFFRAGTFIHEIVHMPARQMVWFKRAWNLLIGVPMLMPWVLYRNHLDHHNHRTFGTPDDGEYLPLATSPLPETAEVPGAGAVAAALAGRPLRRARPPVVAAPRACANGC